MSPILIMKPSSFYLTASSVVISYKLFSIVHSVFVVIDYDITTIFLSFISFYVNSRIHFLYSYTYINEKYSNDFN